MLAAEGVRLSEDSIRESGLKWRKGEANPQPRRILDQALRDGFRTPALDLESIPLSAELRHEHGDPFDHLLYAQAKHHGYRLMTMARALSSFGTSVVNPQ